MLLHTPLYIQEKDLYELLMAVRTELDDLYDKRMNLKPDAVTDIITRLCCKLDAIDTKDSSTLRTTRKELLKKAQEMDFSSS